MAGSDPPQPIPFPVRIVQDTAGKAKDGSSSNETRTDYFYAAWDKFLALEPQRTAGPVGEGSAIEKKAPTTWEQAANECRNRVAAIVQECQRLNQKYSDVAFDLEDDDDCLRSLGGLLPRVATSTDTPSWVKRVEDIFDNPQFFIEGASPHDVHQGATGDCWFLAALMAVSAKPELISHLCVARDEKVGVFGFVFFRDGEWIHEVVDDKLYLQVGDDDDVKVVRDWCNTRKTELSLAHDEEKLKNTLQRGGKALYFSYCKSDETWLPLIEKAYAKAHGDYYAIEGGHPSEGIEDLTGGVADTVRPGDIMDKDRFWIEQLSQVNEKYLFGGSTKSKDAKGIASNHAYAVLQAWEEGELRLLELRNPWGKQGWEGDWSDGSKLWTPEMMRKLDYTFGDDGVFWISYADFLAHFRSINRVRLLDKSWQVAQTWTSVNVPWTVDYLDTKFLFTIDKNCSVVVVLSQPDDRYWLGLRGRFLFSMHFRVVKEGEDEVQWVVRSMRNSGGETTSTRSVSAEIEDLEPGAYAVLVKVTATRASEVTTGQEAIFKHAHDRKEKLLHVGRRYDYAHSKGDLRGLEEANQRQAKQEKRDQDIERKKSARKHNQQEKERKRKCKKRIDDAKKAKRREFETKQREKAKSRKLRAETKGAEKDEHASGDGEESLRSWEKEKDKGTCAEGDDAKDGAEEANDEGNDADAQGQRTTSAGQGITERITKLLARRASDSGTGSSRRDSVFPVVHDHDDDDDDEEHSDASSQSPSDPPEDLDDDDFSWNSEIDNPIDSDTDSAAGPRLSASSKDNEIFAADPWNAMCVLGLRVYARDAVPKVEVVKGRNSS